MNASQNKGLSQNKGPAISSLRHTVTGMYSDVVNFTETNREGLLGLLIDVDWSEISSVVAYSLHGANGFTQVFI